MKRRESVKLIFKGGIAVTLLAPLVLRGNPVKSEEKLILLTGPVLKEHWLNSSQMPNCLNSINSSVFSSKIFFEIDLGVQNPDLPKTINLLHENFIQEGADLVSIHSTDCIHYSIEQYYKELQNLDSQLAYLIQKNELQKKNIIIMQAHGLNEYQNELGGYDHHTNHASIISGVLLSKNIVSESIITSIQDLKNILQNENA